MMAMAYEWSRTSGKSFARARANRMRKERVVDCLRFIGVGLVAAIIFVGMVAWMIVKQ